MWYLNVLLEKSGRRITFYQCFHNGITQEYAVHPILSQLWKALIIMEDILVQVKYFWIKISSGDREGEVDGKATESII